jgi:hypothetical protein
VLQVLQEVGTDLPLEVDLSEALHSLDDGTGCVNVDEFLEWWTHPLTQLTRKAMFGKLLALMAQELRDEAAAALRWDPSELQELLSHGTVSHALEHVRGLGMSSVGVQKQARFESMMRSKAWHGATTRSRKLSIEGPGPGQGTLGDVAAD